METTLACAPPLNNLFLQPHEYEYSDCFETFMEELIDFNNEDIAAPIGSSDEDNENTTSVDSAEAEASVSASRSASASLDVNYSPENAALTDQSLASELYVPTDALADLEWLSPYMIDEFPSELQAVVQSFDEQPSKEDDETKANQQKNLQGCDEKTKDSRTFSFGQWIPVRVTARRSKRSRTGGRVWTSRPLPPKCSAVESHGSQMLFTFTSSDSSSATSRPPLKKIKANHSQSKKSQELVPPRRCSHCLVQKTPQWRAGPLGPKTLCNACGVRYKSGRLLPEYRPAISPTYLSDVHSNSHRKVLELRRQKEEEHQNFEPPQFYKFISNQEDEEDRREHSTVTEDTLISSY